MHLYELTAKWQDIANLCITMADDDEGQIPAELLRILGEIEGSLDEKLDSCAAIVHDLERQSDALKAEADWLKEKAGRAARHAERLKAYIQEQLKIMGWTSRKVSDRFTLSVQKSPPRVEITDFDSVPHEFDKPAVRSLRIADIMESLKRGREVPGAELVSGQHLRIR